MVPSNDTNDRTSLPSLNPSGSTVSSLRRQGGIRRKSTQHAARRVPEEEPSMQTSVSSMLTSANSSVSHNTQATNPSNLTTADATSFSRDLPSWLGFTESAGTQTSFVPWGLSARDDKPRRAFLDLFRRLLLYLRQELATGVTLGIVSSDYEPTLSNLRAIV